MSKFKPRPLPRAEQDFIAAAEAPRTQVPTIGNTTKAKAKGTQAPAVETPKVKPVVAVAPAPTEPVLVKSEGGLPWEGLDPNAKATTSQTVRLNAYQHAQLKWIAEQEERSLSQVLRRLLGPALDKRCDQ